MKLVDILALHLKSWPRGVDFEASVITQDNDGMLNGYAEGVEPTKHKHCSGTWSGGAFYIIGYSDEDEDVRLPVSDDHVSAVVTRSQWQAAVDALVHPTESMALHHQEVGRITRQWNGEGLPPVGTVCEYRGAHQFDVWSEVKIFAEWGHESSRVVFFDFGDGWREERRPDRFRTVRTQDQIEEMRLSVKEMCAVALSTPVVTCDQAEVIMRRLYDAGYRKSEIVDN